MNSRDADIAIAGGGPVGLSLACALGDCGYSVTVLEARTTASQGGGRTLALSHGTRLILDRIGAWTGTEPATAIRTIHVSQQGGFGRTLLEAGELGIPALGYSVSYARLHAALDSAAAQSTAAIEPGAEVVSANVDPEGVDIGIRRNGQEERIRARLLVIADGGGGLVRVSGATSRTHEYGQEAVVALVRTSRPHGNRAYERFTPGGPVALLPFEDGYALIWTVQPEAAPELVALPEREFLARLQRHFGDRAGEFREVRHRNRFALAMRVAADRVQERTVLLGNASQSLHPIAGQGFNLGLRDAWELAEALRRQAPADPGTADFIRAFRAARRFDRCAGIAVTHSLVGIFAGDLPPLRAARGAALALLDVSPAARRFFARRMIHGAPG